MSAGAIGVILEGSSDWNLTAGRKTSNNHGMIKTITRGQLRRTAGQLQLGDPHSYFSQSWASPPLLPKRLTSISEQ
ncbi:hypothetical protein [Cyanobacterium sp. uoEpiScrs1]|uniref:hypothetical protein n=1 Tax=Cyanobacterium sp. uoEpiScrs1 TaxID=2976343 RepID=UPI00226AD25D|nr:hypothetical protein [Cyanobacterium sp. uoEpiScrs1]